MSTDNDRSEDDIAKAERQRRHDKVVAAGLNQQWAEFSKRFETNETLISRQIGQYWFFLPPTVTAILTGEERIHINKVVQFMPNGADPEALQALVRIRDYRDKIKRAIVIGNFMEAEDLLEDAEEELFELRPTVRKAAFAVLRLRGHSALTNHTWDLPRDEASEAARFNWASRLPEVKKMVELGDLDVRVALDVVFATTLDQFTSTPAGDPAQPPAPQQNDDDNDDDNDEDDDDSDDSDRSSNIDVIVG